MLTGSSNGRFTITYATNPELLSKEDINGVGYSWINYQKIIQRYNPQLLHDGWNIMPNGEEIYFVSSPASGLWYVD